MMSAATPAIPVATPELLVAKTEEPPTTTSRDSTEEDALFCGPNCKVCHFLSDLFARTL